MALPDLLSSLGLLVWLGYEIILRSRDEDALSWRARRGDRGSTYLIIGGYLAVMVLTNLHSTSAGHLRQQWRWAGVAMIAAGLPLRAWSMRTLGGSFTRTLRTSGRQALIQTGPYRLIRHPGYAGSLLVWTGYALGEGNWVNALLAAGILLATYTWRISAEEKLLRNAFDPQYEQYSEHTKKLVPFIY